MRGKAQRSDAWHSSCKISIKISIARGFALRRPLTDGDVYSLLRGVVSHRPTVSARAVCAVSLVLLAATFVSPRLAERELRSLLLFTVGFAGESNVGAWWSGTLFFVAGVFALDRAAIMPRTDERRGWAALAAALLLLSLDEVAWLHEWLIGRGRADLLMPLGLVGLGFVAFALAHLQRARLPLRALMLGFALLATVPLHELFQDAHVTTNPWTYGAWIALEEGTEIAAALVLLAATSGGVRRFEAADRPQPFVCFARFAAPLLWLSIAALPLAIAAAYALNLTGATNWLGATLFVSCALLASRAATQGDRTALAKTVVYLLASLGAVAVRPDWDPVVLGQHVNVRGLYFGALLLTASTLTPGAPWRRRAFWLALAAATVLAAFVLLRPQWIWSSWPPTVALLCFCIEVRAVVRLQTASAGQKRVKPVSRAAAVGKLPVAGP
jgi:hypothetical protein